VASYLLDADTKIQCPHGGKVQVKPGRTALTLADKRVYVVNDFDAPSPVISGCSFNISGSPSPCSYIQWIAPAVRVKIDNYPALLSTSVGLCLSAARVPQGTALVSGFQTKVQGT
jgi:hypothetical protein